MPLTKLALASMALAVCGALAACSSSSSAGFSPCTKDVASACATDTCYATVADIPTCSGRDLLRGRCGAYDVLVFAGTDTGRKAYYDIASGKLVATSDYSANFGGSETCVGGPSSFEPPATCPLTQIPACADGGADAAP
jgi:hypothetical protein